MTGGASSHSTGRAAAWHVITCEYPPTIGGVASYSHAVATGLAARGCEVHAWTPGERDTTFDGVHVHASPARWTFRDLRDAHRLLDACPSPRTLLVQWVPHGYGYKSVNLPFVSWVAARARRGDRVEVMVHEPWLGFESPSPRRIAAAVVHRLMMLVLLRASSRAFVSIPGWRSALQRLAGRTDVGWLPVPALLPVVANPAAVGHIRARSNNDGRLVVGHFGTYGGLVTDLLEPALVRLAESDPRVDVRLLGSGSDAFCDALVRVQPSLQSRVTASGTLANTELSLQLQACDVMLQPYPDGVSSRRTTVTSLLAHGCAVVTTRGPLTEGLWQESGAVEVVPPNPSELAHAVTRLLARPAERASLGRAARELHGRVFGLDRTLAVLLGGPGRKSAAVA